MVLENNPGIVGGWNSVSSSTLSHRSRHKNGHPFDMTSNLNTFNPVFTLPIINTSVRPPRVGVVFLDGPHASAERSTGVTGDPCSEHSTITTGERSPITSAKCPLWGACAGQGSHVGSSDVTGPTRFSSRRAAARCAADCSSEVALCRQLAENVACSVFMRTA